MPLTTKYAVAFCICIQVEYSAEVPDVNTFMSHPEITYGSAAVPVPDVTPFAAVNPLFPLIEMTEWLCNATAVGRIVFARSGVENKIAMEIMIQETTAFVVFPINNPQSRDIRASL